MECFEISWMDGCTKRDLERMDSFMGALLNNRESFMYHYR